MLIKLIPASSLILSQPQMSRLLAKCLMHRVHLSVNNSGVSMSPSDWLNYTGFQGDVCVAFFNDPPGNKDAMAPNPLMKEKNVHVYNCDDERL